MVRSARASLSCGRSTRRSIFPGLRRFPRWSSSSSVTLMLCLSACMQRVRRECLWAVLQAAGVSCGCDVLLRLLSPQQSSQVGCRRCSHPALCFQSRAVSKMVRWQCPPWQQTSLAWPLVVVSRVAAAPDVLEVEEPAGRVEVWVQVLLWAVPQPAGVGCGCEVLLHLFVP